MKILPYLFLSSLIFASTAFSKKAIDGSEFVGADYTIDFPEGWGVEPTEGTDVNGTYFNEEAMVFQTVNVVLENMPKGVSKELYLEASVVNLGKLPEVKEISAPSPAKVGKYDATHFSYTMDLGVLMLHSNVYVVIEGGGAYIITAGANDEGAATFGPIREKILASFKLK